MSLLHRLSRSHVLLLVIVFSLSLLLVLNTTTQVKKRRVLTAEPDAAILANDMRAPGADKLPVHVPNEYDMIESESCDQRCQEDIQAERLRRVARVCGEEEKSSVRTIDQKFVDKLNHIYVLDSYKVLLCYVPKVACTNLKHTLLILSGIVRQQQNIGHMSVHGYAGQKIPTLKNFNAAEATKRLNEYKKVLFVREPMSRLISAYRDKLEKPLNDDSRAFRRIYSSKIMGIDLSKMGKMEKRPEFNTSFYDFISYVGDPASVFAWPGEEHWRTVDDLCRPCQVQYDFIGRMETLQRDRDYVLRHVFNTDPEKVRIQRVTNPTNSSRRSLVDEYAAEIPSKKMEALYQRFHIDFDAFGYPSPLEHG